MRNNILFALFLLLSGCGGGGKEEASMSGRSAGQTERPPVSVAVATAQERQVPETFVAVGTVQSAGRTAISPQVMGRIIRLTVREGDRVRAGQVVAEIDDAEAASRVLAAEAAVTEAKMAVEEAEAAIRAARTQKSHADTTLSRYQSLVDEKVVSRQEYETIKTQSDVAKADVERLVGGRERAAAALEQARAYLEGERIRHGYGVVKAIKSGVVVEKRAEAGDMAVPGTPILVVEDEKGYLLHVQVAETDLFVIRPGKEAILTFDAIPGRQFAAKVMEIVPTADPVSRTITVKVGIPEAGVRSGMYGKAAFVKGVHSVLTLPSASLTQLGGITGVYVINERSEAIFKAVKTGRGEGDLIEVLSGMSPGDRVAVFGINRLTDGAKVVIIE